MKRTALFFAIFFIASSGFAKSDTGQFEIINNLLSAGDHSYEKSDYDSAFFYYNKALKSTQQPSIPQKYKVKSLLKLGELYLTLGKMEKVKSILDNDAIKNFLTDEEQAENIDILDLNADFLYSLGKYDDSKAEYNRSLELRKRIYGEESLEVADGYNNIAKVIYKLNDYPTATAYFEKALNVRLKLLPPDHQDIGASYNNLAIAYGTRQDLNKSIEYHGKSLQIKLNTLDADHPKLATSYNNIGNLYFNKGDIKRAYDYYTKALEIREKKLGPDHFLLGSTYSGIGACYYKYGIYDKSRQFYDKALAIYINALGSSHVYNASIYSYIGACLFEQNKYNEAIEYWQKAVSIYINTFNKYHADLGQYYNNIARSYMSLQKPDSAIYYARLTEHVKKATYQELGANFAEEYLVLGDVYSNLENDSAEYFYKKAIKHNDGIWGINSKNSVNAKISLAVYYSTKNNFKAADKVFYNALISYGFDINKMNAKDIAEYKEKPKILRILYEFMRHKQNQLHIEKGSDSKTALLAAIALGNQLIDLIVQENAMENVLSSIPSLADNFYKKSVEVIVDLADEKNKEVFNKYAFQIAEKNKSVSLLFNHKESEARSFSSINDKLIKEEQDLKVEISYINDKISEAGDANDSSKILELTDEKFNLLRKHDDIIAKLEKKYPDYYRYKYSRNEVDIQKVQEKLKKNEAIIEYFLTDKQLYTFVISKNDLNIISDNLPEKFFDQIFHIRKGLINFSEKNYQLEEELRSASNVLVKSQLQLLNENIDHLYIVPDGILSYLPFEILYKNSASDYLIFDYNIGYIYSSAIFIRETNREKIKENNSLFAGFAPEYHYNLTAVNSSKSSKSLYTVYRKDEVPLPMANTEVKTIASILDGDAFTGKSTTESFFKENAGKYNVLHLSLHGIIDDDNPLMSSLIFNDEDSINDGYLNAMEIFNLDLNADMVVISACNSGIGQIQKGEGVMSLSRAFAYAGCPSTVMSLWKVSDKSASEIMINFYKHLNKGHEKDKALRLAKLDYLNTTTDPMLKHPFFWATFVPVGNMEPIISKSNNQVWLIIIGVILFLSAVYYVNYQRSRKKL